MKVITKVTCVTLALGLGVTSLLTAKPAAANSTSSFFGGVVGGIAGSLINEAIHNSRPTQTVIVQPTPVPVPTPAIYPPIDPYYPGYLGSNPYFQQVLFHNGLVATPCSPYAVNIVFGPGQVFCAQPTHYYVPGTYQVQPNTMQLLRAYY
ncbi:hypothetical protein GS597_07120 [Synechococcales cyanobacterium C]|uniref:Uncharacterized protein n=1 Tax=Petrachloros mirabilis ULC683 TaxID=2781853 RepID=A0A8K1ZW22_9CYAN|nr:hypothetical protein [Petrachloros mirabilis]NCJ06285.1 hypothetical protein [Petrachloros mirabilis ULC683]